MKTKQASASVSELGMSVLNIRDAQKGAGQSILSLEPPQSVMIVGKSEEDGIVYYTAQLAKYLINNYSKDSVKIVVYVDEKIKEHAWFPTDLENYDIRFWTPEWIQKYPGAIDLLITMGGDGTVLRAAWLFQNCQVPPVLPFHLGSLGFLTIFKITDIGSLLSKIFHPGTEVRVNMRMRLACTLHKMSDHDRTVIAAMERVSSPTEERQSLEYPCDLHVPEDEIKEGFKLSLSNAMPTETFHILNDLVIDRGPSAFMSMLELFVDEKHLTSVQADGLVIATPTGSTAYSLSAGGSLVHPEVPSFLISPICAHSLSFRPMILPDTCELKIQVPVDSRNTAWVGFDGRERTELKQGDYISVKLSRHPMPSVCEQDQVSIVD